MIIITIIKTKTTKRILVKNNTRNTVMIIIVIKEPRHQTKQQLTVT